MTKTLQRLTTLYVETEDRVRLTGALSQSDSIDIWLSRRLLMRLLPTLFEWLESQVQGRDEPQRQLFQSFAQEAARSALAPQPVVKPAVRHERWLAHTVEVARFDQAVRITFRAADQRQAVILMRPKPLRQWLGILHDQSLKADWSIDVWPEWARVNIVDESDKRMIRH